MSGLDAAIYGASSGSRTVCEVPTCRRDTAPVLVRLRAPGFAFPESRWLCPTHHQEARDEGLVVQEPTPMRTAAPVPAEPTLAPPACRWPGCTRPARARRLCTACTQRLHVVGVSPSGLTDEAFAEAVAEAVARWDARPSQRRAGSKATVTPAAESVIATTPLVEDALDKALATVAAESRRAEAAEAEVTQLRERVEWANGALLRATQAHDQDRAELEQVRSERVQLRAKLDAVNAALDYAEVPQTVPVEGTVYGSGEAAARVRWLDKARLTAGDAAAAHAAEVEKLNRDIGGLRLDREDSAALAAAVLNLFAALLAAAVLNLFAALLVATEPRRERSIP